MQAGAPRSRTLTFGGERNFARQCGSRAQRRRCPRSQRGHTVRRLPASNGLPARALVPRRLARFLQYLANRDFFRTRLLGWLRRVCHLRKRGAAPCEQEAFWMAKSTPAPRVEGHGGLSVKKTCFDEPLRPPEDCPDRAQVRHKPRIKVSSYFAISIVLLTRRVASIGRRHTGPELHTGGMRGPKPAGFSSTGECVCNDSGLVAHLCSVRTILWRT